MWIKLPESDFGVFFYNFKVAVLLIEKTSQYFLAQIISGLFFADVKSEDAVILTSFIQEKRVK